MFHLIGEAAQRTIPELGGLAAEFGYVVAHRVGAAAQCFGYAAQCRGDHIADMVDGLRRARGRAATNRFQAPLQRAQTLFDVGNVGGDGTGISGSRKHGCWCLPVTAFAPLMSAVEPGVDLALGIVLGYAVTLLQPAREF